MRAQREALQIARRGGCNALKRIRDATRRLAGSGRRTAGRQMRGGGGELRTASHRIATRRNGMERNGMRNSTQSNAQIQMCSSREQGAAPRKQRAHCIGLLCLALRFICIPLNPHESESVQFSTTSELRSSSLEDSEIEAGGAELSAAVSNSLEDSTRLSSIVSHSRGGAEHIMSALEFRGGVEWMR